MDNFIMRLSSLLEDKDLTQKKFAELVGVTEVTISRYLSGDRTPRVDILNKMADVLNVTTDFLIGKDNSTLIVEKDSYKNSDEILDEMKLFFMNGKVAEEDKEKIMRDIQELYWESKDINRKNKK